jgi:Cu-processing system permease protein
MQKLLLATLVLGHSTLKEAIRSKLLWACVLFAVLLLGIAVAAASVSIYEQSRLIVDVGLAASSGLGSVMALTAAVGLYGMPLHSQQAHAYLVRPLPRGVFVVGRFVGLAFAMAAVVACMGLSTAALVWVFGSTVPAAFYVALLCAVGQTCMVLAFTQLFCSFATPAAAAIYSSGVLLAGFFSAELPTYAAQAPTGTPAFLLRAAYYLLPDFSRLSVRSEAANCLPMPPGFFWQAPAYALCYAATALCLAVWVLGRRRAL